MIREPREAKPIHLHGGIDTPVDECAMPVDECAMEAQISSPSPSLPSLGVWDRLNLVTSLAANFAGTGDQFITFCGKVENYINRKGNV